MESLLGKILGHYRILEWIGGGGMGEVYLARDERLEREVALKVLRRGMLTDEVARKRFRKEALALSSLNHPNIATLYDFATHDHVDFLIMENVAGETLSQRLREGPLAEQEVVRMGLELAEGLEAAHRRGVIHRDLKPGNLRLTPEGRLKILDFGLAKRTLPLAEGSQAVTESITGVGGHALSGTLPYMAPEQLRDGLADVRSDIWSAGLVLYELATARRAFPQTETTRLVAAILNETVESARSVNRQISHGLSDVISRCMQKDPKGRYQTSRDLASDLRQLGPAPADSGQSRAQGSYRRPLFVTLAALTTVLVIGALAWHAGWLARSPHGLPTHPRKSWILVADFEGPAGDPELAIAARDLVSAALDQSEIVATVPRDQLHVALEMAGKPPTTRVDGALAKELAYRGAVRTVLEGEIGRLGPGYSTVLRVVDAESLKVIITERATADNENALIPTLDHLARKVRKDLGENLGALRATRDKDIVATPSFEANRLLVQGQRVQNTESSKKALPVYRDALALDPDFAVAWWGVGICYSNLGQYDSAVAAFDEALRRPQRLTTSQRLNVEASRAMANVDSRTALTTFDRILLDNPVDIAALTNQGVTLWSLGRFQDALESIRRAGRATPFGPGQVLRANEVTDLYSLGRIDEARVAARYLRGPLAQILGTNIEIAAHNWAGAESVATAALTNPDLDDDDRAMLFLNLASAQAGRGAFTRANRTFARAEESSHDAMAPYQDMARRSRLMLTVVSGGTIPLPVETWAHDQSTAGLITRGLRAAIAGDESEARRQWDVVRARSPRDMLRQGAAPALLQARVFALSGKWAKAARLLQPVASQHLESGNGWYPAGMSAVRWFLADAFERLDRPDSAAVYLEKIVADPGSTDQESHLLGIAWTLAHRRLVMLYTRMGRIEDARRHWEIFQKTFSRPDPEFGRMIEEARTALTTAEGTK